MTSQREERLHNLESITSKEENLIETLIMATSPTDVIPLKKRIVENGAELILAVPVVPTAAVPTTLGTKKRTPEQSRSLRLAQNRKAARESRRRKKTLVEELQRSLVFFSRTNAVLKQQNEDLTRRILESHSVLAKMGEPVPSLKGIPTQESQVNGTPRLEASLLAPTPVAKEVVVADVASPSPQGAAGAACLIKPRPATLPLPIMQPGATMQAMADFQSAAAVAMQAAEMGMKATMGTFPVTHGENEVSVQQAV
jgi:hypothetical protein